MKKSNYIVIVIILVIVFFGAYYLYNQSKASATTQGPGTQVATSGPLAWAGFGLKAVKELSTEVLGWFKYFGTEKGTTTGGEKVDNTSPSGENIGPTNEQGIF